MKVVLLCGGLGTRLREYTDARPKPMVEVGGKPVLWHIMKTYAHHGFEDFVICLGYKGEVIREYFAANREFRVELADTGADTMTGGRIKAIEPYVGGKTFLASYGDGLSDVAINDVVRFHQSHGGQATVTAVQPQSRFGVLRIGPNGRVDAFAEKPKSADWINAGYFVFEPLIFSLLEGPSCILERAPLETLAQRGQLHAFRHDGFFQAMDTAPEHQLLNKLWDEGHAPWRVWPDSTGLLNLAKAAERESVTLVHA